MKKFDDYIIDESIFDNISNFFLAKTIEKWLKKNFSSLVNVTKIIAKRKDIQNIAKEIVEKKEFDVQTLNKIKRLSDNISQNSKPVQEASLFKGVAAMGAGTGVANYAVKSYGIHNEYVMATIMIVVLFVAVYCCYYMISNLVQHGAEQNSAKLPLDFRK